MKKLINFTTVAHLLRGAFSLTLILISIQLMVPLAHGRRQTAAQQSLAVPTAPQGGCSWTAGPTMPAPIIRAVGVYFPANGRFYAMGGRTSDLPGSNLLHPYEYDPSTNTWTTKAATYPDDQVNNMACGVLTQSGTPYIYCVGGSGGASTATDRVFRYNAVTDSITIVPAPWIGNNDGTLLPGGFTVYLNKLYLFGGFHIGIGMDNRIWQFNPDTNMWVQKNAVLGTQLGYIPTATVGNFIYTIGGSTLDSQRACRCRQFISV